MPIADYLVICPMIKVITIHALYKDRYKNMKEKRINRLEENNVTEQTL